MANDIVIFSSHTALICQANEHKDDRIQGDDYNAIVNCTIEITVSSKVTELNIQIVVKSVTNRNAPTVNFPLQLNQSTRRNFQFCHKKK